MERFLDMETAADAEPCANGADCLDAHITDAGLVIDASVTLDAETGDADAMVTVPYVDDPLSLPQSTFFNCDSDQSFVTPSRIWRMTDRQYQRQLDAIIQGESKTILGVSNPFSGLHSGEQFSQPAHAFGMDDPTFNLLRQVSTAVAEFILSLRGRWLLPECAFDDADDEVHECLRDTMRRVARVAWRRPPTEAEVDRYSEAIISAEELDRSEKYKTLLEAIALSPHAYFRIEIGEPIPGNEAMHRLTQHELASALSFSVQDAPPGENLARMADEGRLYDADVYEREVRRILMSRDQRFALSRFFREFFRHANALSVFKDPEEFPNLDVASAVRSANFTVDYLVRLRGDTVTRLLTSNIIVSDLPFSCASCANEEELGAPGLPEQHSPNIRSGILTHPAWLMAFSRNDESDPVARGLFVREALLCQNVPDVPIGVIPQLPPHEEGMTMRDRLQAHSQAECAGCHSLIDPLGLPFETYDHIGRMQVGPNSPIDPSGVLNGAGDVDGPVDHALELTQRLAESDVVRKCVTRTALRFFYGRPEQPGDACTLSDAHSFTQENQGDFSRTLTALFMSEAFQLRQPPTDMESP